MSVSADIDYRDLGGVGGFRGGRVGEGSTGCGAGYGGYVPLGGRPEGRNGTSGALGVFAGEALEAG